MRRRRKPAKCEWCQSAYALPRLDLCPVCLGRWLFSLHELATAPRVQPYDLEAEDFFHSIRSQPRRRSP